MIGNESVLFITIYLPRNPLNISLSFQFFKYDIFGQKLTKYHSIRLQHPFIEIAKNRNMAQSCTTKLVKLCMILQKRVYGDIPRNLPSQMKLLISSDLNLHFK